MEYELANIGRFTVGVNKGTKSENDFRVVYREKGKRQRTPKHIHLLIDILIKRECEPELTQELILFLNEMIGKMKNPTAASCGVSSLEV